MPDSPTTDDRLASWLTVIDRGARRHSIVDRSLRDNRSGILTVPLRFGFKVLEIGPVAASRLAIGFVADKLGLH